jgi:hypothetical protein
MDPLDLAGQWSGLTLTALGTLGPPIYLREPMCPREPKGGGGRVCPGVNHCVGQLPPKALGLPKWRVVV